jgi:4,5-dihydroxyphthalate decarboxylase
VVSAEVAKRPELVEEIWRMLKETKKAMPAPADGVDVHPFGWDENRRNLELIIQFAYEQQMLPRMMSVDELITDATRNLKP